MRTIIESVVDTDSWFEIGKMWGRSIITGFARLDGWPVAIVASDPYHHAGAWTAKAAEKVTRFADLAQTFHLPAVRLADIPGFHLALTPRKQQRFVTVCVQWQPSNNPLCRGARF